MVISVIMGIWIFLVKNRTVWNNGNFGNIRNIDLFSTEEMKTKGTRNFSNNSYIWNIGIFQINKPMEQW